MAGQLSIIRPDDWHLHLRDGVMLKAVAPASAAHFARAMIMPNLVPPITDVAAAHQYRARILDATKGHDFNPYMTLYLTEDMSPGIIRAAAKDAHLLAVKLYPAGATTNSASGVRDIARVMPILELMAECGLPLAIHGEVVDDAVDIFDREKVFIEKQLEPLRRALPDLRVVLEHITTKDAVDYVGAHDKNLGATITAHHLLITRNHILAGGIRPHYYCLPVAKREAHRQALVAAATSGNPRYFFGSDSAPHSDTAKLAPCGCAGIFTAPVAMACLAEIFDSENALDRLEGFTSIYGAGFYGLPLNESRLTLHRKTPPPPPPPPVAIEGADVVIFDPMRPLNWSVQDDG